MINFTSLSNALGIIAELITVAGKAGITAGRNSFLAVWKSGLTKLRRGIASRMSIKVMGKGLVSIASMSYVSAIFDGVKSSAIDWLKYIFRNNSSGIGYIR